MKNARRNKQSTHCLTAASRARPQEFAAVAGRFMRLVDGAATRPLPYYRWATISPRACEAGGGYKFVAPVELAALERQWQTVFPSAGGDPDGQGSCTAEFAARRQRLWTKSVATRWLAFLEMNPAALDSLTILDEVNAAAEVFEPLLPGGLRATFVEPLLKRACDIVEATLSTAGEPLQLAGKDSDHPGFASVVMLCYRALRCVLCEEALAVTAILLRFNTDDAQHRRLTLINLQLMAGNDEIAVAVVRRFGDDGCCDVILAEVLALYRLGRTDEAQGRLVEARAQAICAQAYAQSEGTLRYLLEMPIGTLYRLFPEGEPSPRSAGALGVLTERWVHTPGALEWLRATAKFEASD